MGDDDRTTTETRQASGELPTGLVVAFSAVFVVGFAVVAAVLMTRRKRRP